MLIFHKTDGHFEGLIGTKDKTKNAKKIKNAKNANEWYFYKMAKIENLFLCFLLNKLGFIPIEQIEMTTWT